MTSYDNEENAVVNNEGGISETPSNLVAKSEEAKELSPNPAGFGFTKQLIVTELPASGAVDTLYLVKVTDGGKFIGYRLFKWTKLDGFVQYGATPDLLLKDGPREIPVKVNNAPKAAPEKVFTGDVVFYEEPIIKGKPLHEYIDSQGGVTEAELQAAINALSQTLTGQINQKQDKITTTSAPAGSVEKLLGFNSEGKIVSGDVPAGSTIDDDLDSTSPNPVKNSGIVEGLEKDIVNGYDSTATYAVGDLCLYNGVLYKCVTAITAAEDWTVAHWTQVNIDNEFVHKSELEDYAKVDGNYPTMTVGAADNLTPYDEDSGTDQKQPFLLQGTGCGNGEQQVDTGALALLKEKQGNSVVVNQWAKEITVSNYNIGGIYEGHYSISNNAITFTEVPANSSYGRLFCKEPFVSGHKVLVHFYATVSEGSIRVGLFVDGGYSGANSVVVSSTDTNPNKYLIVQVNQEDEVAVMTAVGSQTSGLVKDLIAVDLTQMFGSNDNIPAHLLSHPEDFFRYYQGDLSYNEGTLVNSNGRYLKTIGRNQFDKSTVTPNKYVNPNTGALASSNDYQATDFIRVNPNDTYHLYLSDGSTGAGIYGAGYSSANENDYVCPVYLSANGNVTIPSNVLFIRFTLANAQVDQATFSIYYEGESGYDQYYPYEELANIDTGTEVLRSAGNVRDSKDPSGKITRRIYSYTFTGNENFTQYGTTWVTAIPTRGDLDNTHISSDAKYKIGYANVTGTDIQFQNVDLSTLAELQAYIAGKTIYYALAEPTTEQGTPFSQVVAIDDFGSMDFAGTNGVPTGNSLFYAIDYKAFIDSLYNTLDGDATDIVKESELDSKLETLGYVKLTSVTGYDATKTQVLKNVEGTLTWVTEE